jgi:hypothetical protein
MSNSILIVGHAALPKNLCDAIIDMHETAKFTELKSMNEAHGGHFIPLHDEDQDKAKFTNDCGVTSYSIGDSNPDFEQILEWIDEFVPWGDDFDTIAYMQILHYPMESYMNWHKDSADEGDTGTVIFNLNEDFTGGNFHVDGHTITPYTGSMVAFNNSTERWHGVEPILTGERYVLSIWFAPPHEEGQERQESMTEYDTLPENVPTHPKTQLKL